MAAKLGIDPLEFRLMNRRATSAAVATPRDVEQEAAYRQTVEAVRPYYEQAKRAQQAGGNGDGRWRRGVGIASMRYGIGYTHTQLPQSVAELESDGRVRLFVGAMDMGQGTDTALGLIAARELTLPLEAVSVVSGDTERTPDTGPSSGSRVIYTDGNAVKEAALTLRDAVLATASELLNISYESLELRDGRVAPRPETGVSGSDRLAGGSRTGTAVGRTTHAVHGNLPPGADARRAERQPEPVSGACDRNARRGSRGRHAARHGAGAAGCGGPRCGARHLLRRG